MKIFFSSIIGIIIVIIIAVVVVAFIGWSRVPDIIANNLSKKMKVYVSIGDMSLGWGKVAVEHVEIGNPPRSILNRAFTCQEIDVLTPFSNYMSHQIVIEEIDVKDVYLGLEFDSANTTNGNWTTIMNNYQASTGAQPAPKAEAGTQRSVLIRKLILSNINVDVVYRQDGGKVKHLPTIQQIELHDISSEGGFPTDQIMNSVLGQMLKSVFEKENLKNMLQDFLQPGNDVQKFIQPFKGLFQNVPLSPQEDQALSA